ncbi:MAG: TfoX/Sxy family protein [Comamonadaceae bacterium]|nr:TfoX/Sxy family protein [Comamonadaceae bacterium]
MKKQDNEFAHYCCELLATAGPCVAKRMFGGYGISTEGLTIAILADLGKGQKLWLKASQETAEQFEAAGCERFIYLVNGVTKSMSYFSAPEAAMESVHEMEPWARMALAAALAARQAKQKAIPNRNSKRH